MDGPGETSPKRQQGRFRVKYDSCYQHTRCQPFLLHVPLGFASALRGQSTRSDCEELTRSAGWTEEDSGPQKHKKRKQNKELSKRLREMQVTTRWPVTSASSPVGYASAGADRPRELNCRACEHRAGASAHSHISSRLAASAIGAPGEARGRTPWTTATGGVQSHRGVEQPGSSRGS